MFGWHKRYGIKPSLFHTHEKCHIHDLSTVCQILLRWKIEQGEMFFSQIKRTLSPTKGLIIPWNTVIRKIYAKAHDSLFQVKGWHIYPCENSPWCMLIYYFRNLNNHWKLLFLYRYTMFLYFSDFRQIFLIGFRVIGIKSKEGIHSRTLSLPIL